jgi:hypothetical protein
LRKLGYRVLWIGSNWTGTEHSNMADRVFRYSRFPFTGEFNSLLWRLTPLRHLEPSVAGSHLFAFNTLESIALDSAATYTFAHLLLPHNPYVFDEQGNIIRNVRQALQFDRTIFGRDERWGDKKGYLAQLRCANQKTLNMIDHMVRNGSDRVIEDCRDHLSEIKAKLKFEFVDAEGKDCGVNVREKAKQIIELLGNEEVLNAEREKARQARNRYTGVSASDMGVEAKAEEKAPEKKGWSDDDFKFSAERGKKSAAPAESLEKSLTSMATGLFSTVSDYAAVRLAPSPPPRRPPPSALPLPCQKETPPPARPDLRPRLARRRPTSRSPR